MTTTTTTAAMSVEELLAAATRARTWSALMAIPGVVPALKSLEDPDTLRLYVGFALRRPDVQRATGLSISRINAKTREDQFPPASRFGDGPKARRYWQGLDIVVWNQWRRLRTAVLDAPARDTMSGKFAKANAPAA
jgi:hypothetical protein